MRDRLVESLDHIVTLLMFVHLASTAALSNSFQNERDRLRRLFTETERATQTLHHFAGGRARPSVKDRRHGLTCLDLSASSVVNPNPYDRVDILIRARSARAQHHTA